LTEESLYKHLIKFGGIESIKIMPPKSEGIFNKNIAFVKFMSPKYAKTAKDMMNEKIISGNLIRIKWGKKLSPFSSNLIPDHVNDSSNLIRF
jgi:RNA recognition motif-containing protein